MTTASHRPEDGRQHSGIEMLARGLVVRGGTAGPEILLCRSLKGGYTYLPGGHVEFGETASEALGRELWEESRLGVRVGACLLTMEERFEQNGRPRHEYSLVFHVEHLEGEDTGVLAHDRPPTPVVSSEPHIAFEWVRVADLERANLRPNRLVEWLRLPPAQRPHWLG